MCATAVSQDFEVITAEFLHLGYIVFRIGIAVSIHDQRRETGLNSIRRFYAKVIQTR